MALPSALCRPYRLAVLHKIVSSVIDIFPGAFKHCYLGSGCVIVISADWRLHEGDHALSIKRVSHAGIADTLTLTSFNVTCATDLPTVARLGQKRSQKHACSNSREFTLTYSFCLKVVAHTKGKSRKAVKTGKSTKRTGIDNIRQTRTM